MSLNARFGDHSTPLCSRAALGGALRTDLGAAADRRRGALPAAGRRVTRHSLPVRFSREWLAGGRREAHATSFPVHKSTGDVQQVHPCGVAHCQAGNAFACAFFDFDSSPGTCVVNLGARYRRHARHGDRNPPAGCRAVRVLAEAVVVELMVGGARRRAGSVPRRGLVPTLAVRCRTHASLGAAEKFRRSCRQPAFARNVALRLGSRHCHWQTHRHQPRGVVCIPLQQLPVVQKVCVE